MSFAPSPSDPRQVVLACDLGSTSLRAGLVGVDGALIAEASVPAPVPSGSNSWSEVAPEAWWQGFSNLAAMLAAQAPANFRRCAAIAICGATRAQVYLGADGRPVRPSMVWNDTRAEGIAAGLRAGAGATHPEMAQVNASHPLARLVWIAAAEPAHAATIATVLDPKDFLNFRLTGIAASDPVSMARLLAAHELHQGRDLLGPNGIRPTLIPAMREPWQVMGAVSAGLSGAMEALAGLPVICGSNDTFAAVIGLGAMRAGYAYNISGTTEVLGVLGDRPATATGLIGLDWRGVHHLGGPSQNGADLATWLAGLIGTTDAGALDALLDGQRHPPPLIFLPYLGGERVPYWDPDLRGAFLGLSRGHGSADLVHAVFEGVAYQNRLVLERAEAALGQRVGEIRFGGGGAASRHWRQIKADVLGRPVVVGAAREPGLTGAAALAFVGLGVFASLAAAQDAMVAATSRYLPDPVRAARYDALYALFRQAEAAVAPLSHALADL